jgi:hypothetical protein
MIGYAVTKIGPLGKLTNVYQSEALFALGAG